jgi:hypothetical protein
MSFSLLQKRKSLGHHAIFLNLIFSHPLAPLLTKASRGMHPCAPPYKFTPGVCLHLKYFLLCFKGFTTDGEFNSLRTSGTKRPISIIEIIKKARNIAKGMRCKEITKYFTLDKEGIV